MRVHHLNCGTMRLLRRSRVVLHCLLIDTDDGLLLVDTGWGTQDYTNPTRAVRWTQRFIGSPRDINEAAVRQVKGLGYDPADVKHIVMTHLHIDHAGGLCDFPQAKVHVYADEYEAATHQRRTLFDKIAYIPGHWSHGPDWVIHALEGDRWLDFDATPAIQVGNAEIRLIPLVGHSRGHCGVCVRLADDRWILHCGDSYVYRGHVDLDKPFPEPKGLQAAMAARIPMMGALFDHVPKLRTLRLELGDRLVLFCSHDAVEFDQLESIVHE